MRKQKFQKEKRPNSGWIYGRHAVTAALSAGRRQVHEVLLTKTPEGELARLLADVQVRMVSPDELEHQFKDEVHQGIAARVGPLPEAHLQDVWESPLLLALDQVSDPHNLGAILRSAAAFGCGGVLVPLARTAPLSDVVAKTACGALESVPVVACNLAQTLEKLKDKGYWSIGLAGEATETLGNVGPFDKTILVLGSEGEGLRPLVREHCDVLAKINISDTMESLNVSVAAGVALYEISRESENVATS